MDARIRERLVGALVLVALVVLLVPALLKGSGGVGDQHRAPDKNGVEIKLDSAAAPAESEDPVPEPEIAKATAEPAATPVPDRAERVPPPASTAIARPEPPGLSPAASAVPAAGPQTAWAVQLGAFSSRSKAEGLVARLRSNGYSAFVLEYRAGGQLLHRVRVGPEQDRARAVAIAERLRNDGFQPVVAPHP